MTPEELDATRRHVGRMSDRELGDLYVQGSGTFPVEAWQMLEDEVSRRERARRVSKLRSGPAATATDDDAEETPTEKSDAAAILLSFLFGPAGLWYKGQWAAGWAWIGAGLLFALIFARSPAFIFLLPFFWVGMAIHAAMAKVKH